MDKYFRPDLGAGPSAAPYFSDTYHFRIQFCTTPIGSEGPFFLSSTGTQYNLLSSARSISPESDQSAQSLRPRSATAMPSASTIRFAHLTRVLLSIRFQSKGC
jgi:hypothetical protein